MQPDPDHYNWTQRNWRRSLSGVSRQKVIKPALHYSPLTSNGVMIAVWMVDNMNIHLHDLKNVLWLWNDTSHALVVPWWHCGGDSMSKLWHDFHLLFFLFFFITTYFESNTAVGRYLKQHAWRGKKHISKFVKEINWMLLTQDIFPKKLWPVCMQLE